MRWGVLLAICLAGQAAAETVVATRTIRPQQVISAEDVRLDPAVRAGAHTDLKDVVGFEARVALYPGRAIMQGALTEPAIVNRNQPVELVFARGGLRIAAEGRALARGGVGDRIRVMNSASRSVLFGTIQPDASVLVSQ